MVTNKMISKAKTALKSAIIAASIAVMTMPVHAANGLVTGNMDIQTTVEKALNVVTGFVVVVAEVVEVVVCF